MSATTLMALKASEADLAAVPAGLLAALSAHANISTVSDLKALVVIGPLSSAEDFQRLSATLHGSDDSISDDIQTRMHLAKLVQACNQVHTLR